MDNVTRRVFAAGAALAALGLATGAAAQQPVKIGVIYPLSGNSASAGNYSKMAIEVGADVINNGNAELAKIMPIAKGGGLSGLGGAKIQLIFADNQGTPAAGQNQALRLISEEKVAALIGAYQSGITLTASAIAERHGVPFLTAESVAANLTERGFKWFFRTTPVAIDFARAYSTFLKEQKAAGQKVGSIALVHENTEYGNSVASVIADQFGKDGLPITQKIAYSANSSDVQPQVLQLKEKNPDVVIFISYTSDAILYAKTMKELNWKPSIMIADNAGFNEPAFVKTMGSSVQGLVNRSA
jgi:branched-chain amino acid transport system substrate-binding protein